MGERRTTPETVPATAHLNNMGRDEMNLAEFPLATLADRAPRGCKTLVFEHRIGDRRQGQQRVRRLTVAASDKYGLPTATDDEVVLGLVQLTQAAGFSDRRVRFTRYELIHLLGWRDEGRSYRRLEQSLKRWLGVTLYYENAWRDNAQRRWVDANFHLLDELVLYHRPTPHDGGSAKNNGHASLSSFTWNEMVFQSFRAGFLKKLDLDVYRQLKLAAAKRMYRFLDKHFYFRGTMRLKLREFACEHIGLSRRYDVAQLKRRLTPAVTELERVGFLTPLSVKERYHCLRRGDWEIVFLRAPKPQQPCDPARQLSDVAARLVDRGVTRSTAVQLAGKYSADLIQDKLAVFDILRQKQDRRISKNPAGFLVKSIREDYQSPTCMERDDTRPRVRKPLENVAIRPHNADQKRFDKEQKAVQDYLAGLSPPGLFQLETEALKASPTLLAERYASATESGNQTLIAEYRRCVRERHVRTILGLNQCSTSNKNMH